MILLLLPTFIAIQGLPLLLHLSLTLTMLTLMTFTGALRCFILFSLLNFRHHALLNITALRTDSGAEISASWGLHIDLTQI